jgi:hypothetical protein
MDRWPKCESSTMRFSAATAPEAETFLATTWCILVENALISPQVNVRLADKSIDVRLRFSSAEDCALVRKRFFQILQSHRLLVGVPDKSRD